MNKFRISAGLFLLSSFITGRVLFLSYLEWTSLSGFVTTYLAGIATLLCISFGAIFLVISTQRTSKHYSVLEALSHFIVKYHRLYIGYKMLQNFRSFCENPRKVQEALLQKIIRKNKNTIYGHLFELGSIRSLEDLRKKHLITDYNRYEEFVDRIAKGEKNVMTTQNISRIVLTSGTTGKGKQIPHDEYLVDNIMKLKEALQQEKFPDLHPMQQRFKLHFNAPLSVSEGGIIITAATAVVHSMLKYMVVYSTPRESFMIENVRGATYVHLLFALRDKNLGPFFVTFSSLFLETMKFLEENWKKLVEDLSNGTLNSDLELDVNVRSSLTKALGSGDPQRAIEVQKEFDKGFDGILKRLWPHLNFVATIDNVGLKGRLKKTFAKGLTIYSPIYVCSETLIGLNLWPFEEGEEAEYALNLVDNVFEFIHEEEMDKPNPRTYFVDEVEVGQNYELLFTQNYGLYRYRFGDVIKVSGIYKNCPKVKFLYRKATLLNMVGEKTDQTVILHSLEDAISKWSDRVSMSHYTVAESTLLSDFMGENDKEGRKSNMFYVFFLELKSIDGEELLPDLQPNVLAELIDKNIHERNKVFFMYAKYISRSKVYFVKTGTFNRLKEYLLANTTASRAQLKMPLKLRTKDMAKIMFENIDRCPSG